MTTLFDNYTYTPVNKNKSVFINVYQSEYDAVSRFQNCCKYMLTKDLIDSDTETSYHEFTSLVYDLTNKDPLQLLKLIYDSITYLVSKMIDDVNFQLKNDTFSIIYINTLRQNTLKAVNKFTKKLSYLLTNLIEKVPTAGCFSNVVINMYFYLMCSNMLIPKNFSYKGSKMNMYQIIDTILLDQHMTNTIKDIICLHQLNHIIDFVFKFTNTPIYFPRQTNCIKFFNEVGSNQPFIKKLVEYIHNKMIQLHIPNEDLTTIRHIIKLSNEFDEPELFTSYYEMYLEDRLLENTSNSVSPYEQTVAKYFTDVKFMQSINHKIADITKSKQHKMFYDVINVKTTNDKYKNVTLDKDMSKVTVLTLKYAVWANSRHNNYTNYTVPWELEQYIDVFSAYYSKRYVYQNLHFNFNNGKGVVKLTFGSLPDLKEDYMFELTTPQMILLYRFNKPDVKWTAYELADSIGISLAELSPLLNSFLSVKLLIREIGASNDPGLKFYLNKSFSNPDKQLSLINSVPKNDPANNKEKDIIAISNFAVSRIMLITCLIVNTLKLEQILSVDKLSEIVTSKIKFKIKPTMIQDAIDKATNDGYIKQIDMEVDDDYSVMYTYVDGSNDNSDVELE